MASMTLMWLLAMVYIYIHIIYIYMYMLCHATSAISHL